MALIDPREHELDKVNQFDIQSKIKSLHVDLIDESNRLPLFFAPTKDDGFSFGLRHLPNDIHLHHTLYRRDNKYNSHLTEIRNGVKHKLVWSETEMDIDEISNAGSVFMNELLKVVKPYDAEGEIIHLSGKGYSLMIEEMPNLFSFSKMPKKVASVTIDNRALQNLTLLSFTDPSEGFTEIGPASDLLTQPFRFGINRNSEIIIVTQDNRLVSFAVNELVIDSLLPFGEVFFEIFGIRKMHEYFERSGLTDRIPFIQTDYE